MHRLLGPQSTRCRRRHVDMQTEGAEKCSRALDTVVQLPEARVLFDEALERFRDVTCIGLCNWANVHLCFAKKLLEAAATGDGGFEAVREEFEEHCAQSTRRYNEALGYNGAALWAQAAAPCARWQCVEPASRHCLDIILS
jgi:hypothetical protein